MINIFLITISVCCISLSSSSVTKIDEKARTRATVVANNLLCSYTNFNGLFDFELLWQAGNTIETLSNYVTDGILSKNQLQDVLNNTYYLTKEVVDNCYDDNQWWLLGWLSAYEATGVIEYLERAAAVFDYVVANAWTDVCGGGVMWCPTDNPTNEYKNAVTNELFFIAAMRLNEYEKLLTNVTSGYYLEWAVKEWSWFENSGMINSDYLINDGLDNPSCTNNKQTTWTYNQGLLLDALGMLAKATNNNTLVSLGESLAYSSMTKLVTSGTTSDSGILEEPCGTSCNGDQRIFKGVFVRHLSRFVTYMTKKTVKNKATSFLKSNADTVVKDASSTIGGYGVLWQGPNPAESTVAELSAVADLFDGAAINGWSPGTLDMVPLGLGDCTDSKGDTMPSCVTHSVSESKCSEALNLVTSSVAYDYETDCFRRTKCRVFSNGASDTLCQELGKLWSFADGNATTVTSTNKKSRNYDKTLCVLKSS